jgi:hypothetical protein
VLSVIALGRRAQWILARLGDAAKFHLVAMVHPSAQGLLSTAPARGRGQRLVELETKWIAELVERLRGVRDPRG